MAQISIIKLSEVFKENEEKRIDAEFFKPEYIKIEKILYKLKTKRLHNLAKISDGDHAKFPENQKQEIRYLRSKDIRENFLVDDDPIYVSKNYFEKQKRSHIDKLNILISIMGNIGDITLTPENFKKCIANRAICIIKFIKKINPYYLYMYLKTELADKNIQRIKRGGIQERINLDILKNVKIPLFDLSFQKKIELLVKDAYFKIQKSKTFYKQAEEILLKELGLINFKSKHELTFQANLNEIKKTERFDSDFFQPKYKDIEKKIENYKRGFGSIKNHIEIKDKNFCPENEIEYKYIALANVSNTGEIISYQNELGKNLPTRARRLVKTGDLILSSIEGSLETSALIPKEYNNCICSNGFYVLKSNKFNPETLLVLFKSKIIIELLKKASKGTILGGYTKDELQKIKIPLLSLSIQEKISQKIKESHRLKKESKELLEKAKKMVEDEIEKEAKK
jgi:restriction endonuclease S subunit